MGKLRPRPAGKNQSREGHAVCLTQVACSSTYHLPCRQAMSHSDCKMAPLGPRQVPTIESQDIQAGPELLQASGKVLTADELITWENTTRWGAQVSYNTTSSSNWADMWTSPPCGRTQGLWLSGALGLQGHEHLFTSHCAQSTETSQDSCGNTYAHRCAFILANICAVTHTVVHTCRHKAHTGTWAPHWASTLHTHSLDVHITSMKTTLGSDAFTHTLLR